MGGESGREAGGRGNRKGAGEEGGRGVRERRSESGGGGGGESEEGEEDVLCSTHAAGNPPPSVSLRDGSGVPPRTALNQNTPYFLWTEGFFPPRKKIKQCAGYLPFIDL